MLGPFTNPPLLLMRNSPVKNSFCKKPPRDVNNSSLLYGIYPQDLPIMRGHWQSCLSRLKSCTCHERNLHRHPKWKLSGRNLQNYVEYNPRPNENGRFSTKLLGSGSIGMDTKRPMQKSGPLWKSNVGTIPSQIRGKKYGMRSMPGLRKIWNPECSIKNVRGCSLVESRRKLYRVERWHAKRGKKVVAVLVLCLKVFLWT
mmetsp:Transcript_21539/g.30869  ORF Transcript_21539/g.30869 Transcript_21539/m.30869 type:complete len:200 (-) Transcript_21539:182-781(-)